ncbi:MAG: SUMF1/EgtB/PvdO family nonheme iron enzyme [Planctomycetes bacterium]|nr:SUMF1/EgtB/PvdO family nonheme iron enzyme [Planctomycetota bacterium]
MQIGPYEVLEKVAEGGMGTVYRVREPASGREFAVKTLKSSRPQARRRFQREAEAMHALQHPNLVRCVAVGEEDGDPYLVMDYVEGESLQAQLDRQGALSLGDALEVAGSLCDALQAVHARDLLHRDLKPDNVLRSRDGRLLLTDFGLVKRDRPGMSRLESLTRDGSALGTPGYWSPEQARGQLARIGPPTDVYGLAATLYGLLTGAPPRGGTSLVEVITALDHPVPPLSEALPAAPAPLVALLGRALADEPELRPSLEEFAQVVGELLPPSSDAAPAEANRSVPTRGAAWPWALGVIALVGLGAFAALALAPPAARPSLLLTAPPGDAELVGAGEVELRGTVRCESGWVEVRAGGAVVRLEPPGGAFSLRCPTEAGAQRLEVVAVSEAGATSRTYVSFHYTLAPAWYLALPGDARADLPLPRGLEFGDGPGDYRNLVDDSLLRWLPAGSYFMGVDEGDRVNRPRHEVRFRRGFYLGKYELTWGQFDRFCDATGAPRRPRELDLSLAEYRQDAAFVPPDDHPVVGISHGDGEAYCAWAGLRLPSEAEWEYAAGGRHGWRYPWGDAPPDATRLNVSDRSCAWDFPPDPDPDEELVKQPWDDGYPYTAPVGTFAAGASPEGIYNLAGNVSEWTADGYVDHYRGAPSDGRPRPLSPGGRGVLRGGSFGDGLLFSQRVMRSRALRSPRGVHTRGVRVARDPE